MAGEPALDKVLTALQTALAGAGISGIATVDIDRPADQAYGNAELDALNILYRRTSFSQQSHGATLHRADIDIDMIVAVVEGASNGKRLREIEAGVIAALWANRTLGGLAQDIVPQSSGGDEDDFADVGGRALQIEIMFLTPTGDHRTIIGASGLVP